MTDFLRYGWPRWYLVRFTARVCTKGKLHDRLLDFLYPEDLGITFK